MRRGFGFHEVRAMDPFLLLDDFRSENPEDYKAGFPWHPHRGIETITYVLDGDVEHGDSLGNRGVISSGDIQWMTAGGGIVHQEMPQGDKRGRMAGFQLWANLPRTQKLMEPRYREVKAAEIPIVKTPDGATVRVVSGEVGGVRGPVRDIVIDPEYLDVSLPAGGTFSHPVKDAHTVFAYVFEGEVRVGAEEKTGSSQGEGSVILFRSGPKVVLHTDKPTRLLLVAGQPLKEPIAWYGPIVMNTQEELRTAFREYEEGRFVSRARS